MSQKIHNLKRIYVLIPVTVIIFLLVGLAFLKLTACYDCCNKNPISTCAPSFNKQSDINNIYLVNDFEQELTHYYYYSNGDLYANYLGEDNDIHIYKTNVSDIQFDETISTEEIEDLEWTDFYPQYYQLSLVNDDSDDKYVDGNTDERITQFRKYYDQFNIDGIVTVDSTVPIYRDLDIIEEIRVPVSFSDGNYLYTQKPYLNHEVDQNIKDNSVNISDIDYLFSYSDDCSSLLAFEDMVYSDIVCLNDITLSGYTKKYTLFILDSDKSKKTVGIVDPIADKIVFSQNLTNNIKPIFANYNDFYRIAFLDKNNKTVSIGIFHKHPDGYTFTIKK